MEISLLPPPDLQAPGRGAATWAMLSAARAGDAATLARLLAADASLVDASFWYMPPLHFAAREGHLAAVQVLVAAGADLSYRSSLYGNDTLVTLARERGHAAVADYLLTQQTARQQAPGAETPLHLAAAAGDLAQAQALLAADPTLIHAGDHLGRPPFQRAMEGGSIAVAGYLLEHGARIDAPAFSSDARLGGDGFRPIVLALWHHPYWRQRNHYALAGYLLARGAATTITIAAALGDLGQVRALLARDRALANAAEPCGKRPLSAAAERGHTAIVRLLLEHGADPNLPEGRNCPRGYALWAAAQGGYREIVELLLAHGADPNAEVESSGTPTCVAKDDALRALLYRHGGKLDLWTLLYQGNLDTIAALLDHAPSLFADPTKDGTPFTAVATPERRDILELLLARGLRVPPVVTGCQTYLWSHADLARLLLQHGMDPSLPNWQRITPLHHLGRSGEVDKARLFLEFGADVNGVDEEYRSTPLGWAARFGQLAMVELYLAHGADATRAGARWATPLAWATARNHPAIADRLRAHLAATAT